MFGRIVSIDGREIFVTCTPQTPYSEICRRAADQLAKDERLEADRKQRRIAYRLSLTSPESNSPDDKARCNHWPGQDRCGVCGMDETAVARPDRNPTENIEGGA